MTESEVMFSIMENQHIDFVLKFRELPIKEKDEITKTMHPQLLEYYKTCFWDKDFEDLTRLREENNKMQAEWAEENISIESVK